MRLLQRYILIELLRVFTLTLTGLTIMLVFVGVIREATERGLDLEIVLEILPFIIPSLLPFTIPATLLLTVCVVYGRMAGDLETTASKAAGINILSLLWPSFILGAVLSIGSLLMTDQVIPWATEKIENKVALKVEDIFFEGLRSQHSYQDKSRGIWITVKGVQDKTLIQPTFQIAPGKGSPTTLRAETATLNFDMQKRALLLNFTHCSVSTSNGISSYLAEKSFEIPLPDNIRNPKPRHLTIERIHHKTDQVNRTIDENREWFEIEAGFDLALGKFDHLFNEDLLDYDKESHKQKRSVHKLNTEVHSRFALASSCFFFALIGGPFSIAQGKKQLLTNFFVCFLPILMVYYPIVFLMMNLSKSGTLSPVWAMWVANLVLLLSSLLVLRKVMQH